jgi:hypothetical protein
LADVGVQREMMIAKRALSAQTWKPFIFLKNLGRQKKELAWENQKNAHARILITTPPHTPLLNNSNKKPAAVPPWQNLLTLIYFK